MNIDNEYRADGKLFVRRISAADCREKIDGSYKLLCRIKQHGIYEYDYTPGSGYIKKQWDPDLLWLSQEAEQTAVLEINKFELGAAAMRTDPRARVVISESNASLFINHTDREEAQWDVLAEYRNGSGEEVHRIKRGYFVDLLRGFFYSQPFPDDAEAETVFRASLDRAMRESTDPVLKLQLKMFCRAETDEDCRRLSGLLSGPVLKRLSKEYNRNYSISSLSIDHDLLRRSGYLFLHRPYFAMAGCTHRNWQLNPFSKTALDAAPSDGEPHAFQEYLNMFSELPDTVPEQVDHTEKAH